MHAKTFTCLIPAHNEAARIGAVLAAVRGTCQPAGDCAAPERGLLAEVIVIDDGSDDGTADLAEAAGARTLRLSPNRGKSGALAAGLAMVKTSHVVLLDDDLIGLTSGDIARLMAPVVDGRADASLSLRGNAPLIWRMLGVDYITGERVIPMSVIRPFLQQVQGLPGFGFEVFLNEVMRDAHLVVGIVSWPGVISPTKAHKRGAWAGMVQDIGMIGDILRTIGVMTALRQMAFLWRFGRVARLLTVARGI